MRSLCSSESALKRLLRSRTVKRKFSHAYAHTQILLSLPVFRQALLWLFLATHLPLPSVASGFLLRPNWRKACDTV